MARVRIIPGLLMSKGGLYKTIRFQNAKYVGDPINSVKIFNEKQADEIILLDFLASKEKRGIDFSKIEEIAGEAFMPIVFDCGFEKVVLNSILFSDIALIQKIASVYGSQSVVGSIDTKKNILGKYRAYALSANLNTGKEPVEWAALLEKAG